MMQLLRLALALLTNAPASGTDDAWDCYIDGRGVAVCEHTVPGPCHWRNSPDECTIRATWLVQLPGGLLCDLNDPLGCIPAESDVTP